tara:strand:- start:24489 stop:25880 length:1392 start_codon:yes stop_codon:yes gene_type:complete
MLTKETQRETRWWQSGNISRRGKARWIVYDLLINERLIAARIAETMGVGRPAVSKHIKSLLKDRFIVRATGLEEHYSQVKNGSVTGAHKVYISGPKGQVAQQKIEHFISNMGVSGASTPSEATRLPAGVEPTIDLHRLDFQVKLIPDGKNYRQPPNRSMEQWKELGLRPKKGKRLGFSLMGRPEHRSNWGHWEWDNIETDLGEFKVHFKRRWRSVCDEDNNEIGIDWEDWSPTIRITGPRVHLTVQEALTLDNPQGPVGGEVVAIVAKITSKLGFTLGLPMHRQQPEYGTLIHDPELAKAIKERRKTNPKMLEIADGITVDGSHELLDEGFVHIDCETPEQAAAQAAPIKAIDHTMNRITDMMEQFRAMTDSSMEAIEEHAVRTTDNISGQLENQLGTIVQQLQYSMEESIVRMQQRFNEWLDQFAQQQQERIARVIVRFEQRLQGNAEEIREGQRTLFDFED